MARIRSLHPGFWTDENIVSVSLEARMLFIGLWGEADDGGAFPWKPLTLKMRLFPADALDISTLLEELEKATLVKRYTPSPHAPADPTYDSQIYGAIRNFGKWQSPRSPSRRHPMPDELRLFCKTETICPVDPDALPQNAETASEREKEREKDRDETLDGKPSSRARNATGTMKGTRLPSDWSPSEALCAFALEQGCDPESTAAAFRDYWHGAPGVKGRKADWSATWRNWCRRENVSRMERTERAARSHKSERKEKDLTPAQQTLARLKREGGFGGAF